MEILYVPMPVLVKQMPKNTGNNLILYPILVGAAFALAASPCSTPILAGIMAYASIDGNVSTGALMLFLFALGQGVIFVIAALFTSFFKKLLTCNKASEYFVKVSGLVLVFTSVFLYYKVFSSI
jgi:cytochrome c-type biogenesis protein